MYYASYSDNCIFPFYKRVTANGIVQIVARSVTVGASVAAELPRPWPAYILIGLTGLALITAFFLPGYDYEEEFDKRQAELAKESVDKGNEYAGAQK